jgi:hypothetical protein
VVYGAALLTLLKPTTATRLKPSGKQPGMLEAIFRKAQNKIQDPAKLKRLISDLIDEAQWSPFDADVKGDAHEGLLEKNAQDVKGWRGAVIHAACVDSGDGRTA